MNHFLARATAAFTDDTQAAAHFLQWVAQSLPQPPTHLDIGTGPGTLLAFLGWNSHALEPNPEFAAYAQTQGARSVQVGGFRDLDETAIYHIITGLGSPLAYLPHYQARREALIRVKKALQPGGLVVMQIWNMPWVLRHLAPPPPITTTLDHQPLTLNRRHTFDDHHAALTQHESYSLPSGEQATCTHTLYMITVPEIVALYAELGFTSIHTYNGYDARTPAPVSGSSAIITGVNP